MRPGVLAAFIVLSSLIGAPLGAPGEASLTLAIAEVDADQAGTDRWEFVELAGPPGAPLDGFRLVFFSGGAAAAPAYRTVRLDGWSVGPRGRFVVGSALVDSVDLVAWESNGIQNGAGAPDAVALYRDDAAPASPTPSSLVDVVIYGDRDDPLFRARFRPHTPPPLLPADGVTASLSRGWDGAWRSDWPPSPGFANGPARLNEVGPGGEIELIGMRGAALTGLTLVLSDGNGLLLEAHPLSGTLSSGGSLPGSRLLSLGTVVNPPDGESRLLALVRGDPQLPPPPPQLLDAVVIGAADPPLRAALALAAFPRPSAGQSIGRWASGPGAGAAFGPTAPTLGSPNTPPPLTSLSISEARGPLSIPDGCSRPPRWIARPVRLTGTITALVREGSRLLALLQDASGGDASSAIALDGLPAGAVRIGERVTVSGVVGQHAGQTILSAVAIDHREPSGPLPTPRPLPPQLDRCAWAQLEGMRVLVPAGAVASGPRVTLASGETFIDVALGAESDPRKQRVFGPDTAAGLPPDRLVRLSSQALRAAADDAVLPPVHSLDRLEQPVSGVVMRQGGRPAVAADEMPSFSAGPRPRPLPLTESAALRIATFNLRNFFDRWDNPADSNDNPGAPFIPPSVAAYRERLFATADLILGPLGAPDVFVVQEAESQDLCHSGGQAFGRCGADEGSDGLLDVLHDLSIAVSLRSSGSVRYLPAADRRGTDQRGIVTALLYRPDRLEPLPLGMEFTESAASAAPLALNTAADPVVAADGEGELLFSRPPLLMRFALEDGAALLVIGVHFKSTPTDFRPRRAAQAAFVVDLARRALQADPAALVAIAGDFNAPASALPALQEALPGGRLSSALDRVPPLERYTFIFEGVADAIDHVLLSPRLAARLIDARVAHVTADRPDPAPTERGVPPRLSDHEPVVVSFGAAARFPAYLPLTLRSSAAEEPSR
ncbi:MAG: hypothetical protein RMM58_05775 [Chloroflexota bacterium]|nr:hypothetical protein [Dehalococcoidia bacterium]MDW8253370.1 hypothetical protein [Chloroflexota bacterium]